MNTTAFTVLKNEKKEWEKNKKEKERDQAIQLNYNRIKRMKVKCSIDNADDPVL